MNLKRLIFNGLICLAAIFLSGCSIVLTPDKSRDVLEQKYLNADSALLTIAGTPLHVRDTGPDAAPTVILLHGVGSHLQTWDGWARELEVEYRTVRFDLPGAGLSPPDETGDYTDARAATLINALMDTLEIESATLIGNSLGGRIAWTFAVRHPNRADRLVLVSPDGFASPGFEYDTPPDVPFLMGVMRYALPKWILRRTLATAYSDPAKLKSETVQRYFDLLHAPGVRGALIDRMRQTVLRAPEPLLAQISAPVLLLWGEDDAIIPVIHAEDYQAALQDVTVITIPGIGHLPQEEAPSMSVQPVLTFLRTQ